MKVRLATPADDPVLVSHYLALWDSYGTPTEQFLPDARDRVQAFIDQGRQWLDLASFIATLDGEVVGSAACQMYATPYPSVIGPQFRKFGYIWHVYVLPGFKRHGFGKALTQAAVDYLRDVGCTTAVLNASDAGLPLYESMGFKCGTEMRLQL